MNKRGTRNVLIVAGLLVLALILNPDKARHDSAVRAELAQRSPVASLLGVGHLTTWVATYRSIGVGSYTEIDGEVVSYGALGVVFVR